MSERRRKMMMMPSLLEREKEREREQRLLIFAEKEHAILSKFIQENLLIAEKNTIYSIKSNRNASPVFFSRQDERNAWRIV